MAEPAGNGVVAGKPALVPVSRLVPAVWNANRVPAGVLAKIRRSLVEFGVVENLVVREHPGEAGKLEVISGNHRLVLLRELGVARVPVVVVDVDDSHARILAPPLNRTRGEDDPDAYAELLESVLADVGVGRVLEFLPETVGSIDRVLGEFRPPVEDEFTVPVGAPRSVFGEVVELGSHRLMCGDATSEADVELLMGGEKAEMVFTDPPYGVDYDGGTKVRERMAGDDSTGLYEPACEMAARFSTAAAPLYLWHAGIKGIAAAAAAAAAAAGYEIRCEIVWNKNQAQYGALSAQYKQKHEPCYYCFKRGHTVNWDGPTTEVTVWDADRASFNEFHPTQKPVALAVRALRNHTAESVLDLFAGSGSTLVAAEETGRRAFVMEIDPWYCDVIRNRYEARVGVAA